MTDVATIRAVIPAADLLPVQREATPLYRVARAVLHPLMRGLFRVHIHGRKNIPAGSAVVVSNHLQWIDCLMIEMAFPAEPRLHLMGDPSDAIRKGPLFWGLLRRIGGLIPIDRSLHGNQVLFDQVHTCLERGGSVMLFPEGRCGDTEGAMLPFKKGFAHFAIKDQVAVVPVALTGTRSLWLFKRIEVVVGEPLDVTGHDADSLVEATRKRMAAQMLPDRRRRGVKLLRSRLTRLF